MVTFFKRTQVWVVGFTYEGRSRKWFKALPQGTDPRQEMATLLQDLYGAHAQLSEVRIATPQEELDYVRGNLPRNLLCPTGRAPLTPPKEHDGRD